MWGTPLLSRLRQSFSKGCAASVAERSPAEQHFGPMSDRQLAMAMRQFQRSPFLNDSLSALETCSIDKQESPS
jgi:hypothetical protein